MNWKSCSWASIWSTKITKCTCSSLSWSKRVHMFTKPRWVADTSQRIKWDFPKHDTNIPTQGIEPGPRRWEHWILTTRPRGKSWGNLAPVVQRLDNAIHWINRYPADKCWQNKHAIHWIVIYPVDSVIHFSNNWGLKIICVVLLMDGSTRSFFTYGMQNTLY